MLPPLLDRTKSFAAVSAVLAVAVYNVVFGMNLVNEPAFTTTQWNFLSDGVFGMAQRGQHLVRWVFSMVCAAPSWAAA
jgi:hypothetical protein